MRCVLFFFEGRKKWEDRFFEICALHQTDLLGMGDLGDGHLPSLLV